MGGLVNKGLIILGVLTSTGQMTVTPLSIALAFHGRVPGVKFITFITQVADNIFIMIVTLWNSSMFGLVRSVT